MAPVGSLLYNKSLWFSGKAKKGLGARSLGFDYNRYWSQVSLHNYTFAEFRPARVTDSSVVRLSAISKHRIEAILLTRTGTSFQTSAILYHN